MQHNTLKTISLFTLCGVLFFAVHHGWIIFRAPWHIQEAAKSEQQLTINKQKVHLVYWHNDQWNTEDTEIIWSDDYAHNIKLLINKWLTLLDEDNIMQKKVTVQSVLISHADQAYLSFDHNPLRKDALTIQKLMWVEGLLKTIKENKIPVNSVWLLVQHQLLKDHHLDFSNPWPINGFLS